jgi:uncharacterized protein YuzE
MGGAEMKPDMANESEIIGFEISVSARDDGTLEAVYFRFREGKVAESRELDEDVMVADYDAQGRLLGVEILAPVKVSELEKLVEMSRRPAFKRFVEKSVPRDLVTV